MNRQSIAKLVRRFLENGIKLLLENPANVRDLLRLLRTDVLHLIDFRRLKVLPTTFVQRDYRHIESDVVLHAPLSKQPGSRLPRSVFIYILIEHQSEPDSLILFRVLEYQVQIYKAQVRAWAKHHASFAGFRFQPVLPIVFYTGWRSWERLEGMTELMELGEQFSRVTPRLEPLFLNLPALPPKQLEEDGGYFGWILRLLQQRRAPLEEFRGTLRNVVEHLETMPRKARLRWLELLSYIEALVSHERERPEQANLRETIEASVHAGEHRQEVIGMGQTIAEALREEGRQEGRQQAEVRLRRKILLRQLKDKFGDLPTKTIRTIKASADVDKLDRWLDGVVTADSLEALKISPSD